jgi:hypothetical protein
MAKPPPWMGSAPVPADRKDHVSQSKILDSGSPAPYRLRPGELAARGSGFKGGNMNGLFCGPANLPHKSANFHTNSVCAQGPQNNPFMLPEALVRRISLHCLQPRRTSQVNSIITTVLPSLVFAIGGTQEVPMQ